jgi:hypothetical protein
MIFPTLPSREYKFIILPSHFGEYNDIFHPALKDSVTRLRMSTIGTKRQIRRISCCRSTFLTLLNVYLCFNSKKHVLTVSHMTVTQRMMSNSRRSSPLINAHLPIDQAGGNYCSDRRKFKKMVTIIQ